MTETVEYMYLCVSRFNTVCGKNDLVYYSVCGVSEHDVLCRTHKGMNTPSREKNEDDYGKVRCLEKR